MHEKLNLALQLLPEFQQRAKRVAGCLAVGLLVGLAYVLTIALCLGLWHKEDPIGIEGLLFLALSMGFDFLPEPPSLSAVPAEWISLTRVGGFIIASVLSGFVVARFLEPLNVIEFARYALIDQDDESLRVRIRIRRPVGAYLYDVRASVSVTDVLSRNSGILGKSASFRVRRPKSSAKYPRGVYDMMRGVWYIDIPLTEMSSDDVRMTLLDSLEDSGLHNGFFRYGQLELPRAPQIAVHVAGVTEQGAMIAKRHIYEMKDILIGYKFVDIQYYGALAQGVVLPWYERARLPRDLRAVTSGRAEDPNEKLFRADSGRIVFSGHFNRVFRQRRFCSGLESCWEMFGENKPRSKDVMSRNNKSKQVDKWSR